MPKRSQKNTERVIEVQMPVKGIHRHVAYQTQPPYTTPDAQNVIPIDYIENRMRCGSRPGLEKYLQTQFNDVTFVSELYSKLPAEIEKSTRYIYPTSNQYRSDINIDLSGTTGWTTVEENPVSTPSHQNYYYTTYSGTYKIESKTIHIDPFFIKYNDKWFFTKPAIATIYRKTTYDITYFSRTREVFYSYYDHYDLRARINCYYYADSNLTILLKDTSYYYEQHYSSAPSASNANSILTSWVLSKAQSLPAKIDSTNINLLLLYLTEDTNTSIFNFNCFASPDTKIPVLSSTDSDTKYNRFQYVNYKFTTIKPFGVQAEQYLGCIITLGHNGTTPWINKALLVLYMHIAEDTTTYNGSIQFFNNSGVQTHETTFTDIEVPNTTDYDNSGDVLDITITRTGANESNPKLLNLNVLFKIVKPDQTSVTVVNTNLTDVPAFQDFYIPLSVPTGRLVSHLGSEYGTEQLPNFSKYEFTHTYITYTAGQTAEHILVIGCKDNIYYTHNKNIYEADIGETTLPTENVNCVEYLQKLYIANPNGKPYVLNIGTQTVSYLTATKGTVPENNPLITRFQDRIVLCGYDHIWYMSRRGDSTDWDFGADPYDVSRAVAGQNSDPGTVGDPIIDVAPFTQDYLIFFARNSIWAMVGSPTMGGRIIPVSYNIGLSKRNAFTYGANNNTLYFLSDNGLHMIVDNQGLQIIPISQQFIPQELRFIPDTVNVIMGYDPVLQGVMIFLYNTHNTVYNTAWMFHEPSQSFWKLSYDTDHFPQFVSFYTPSVQEGASLLLFGSDGYVRIHTPFALNDDGITVSSYLYLGAFNISSSNMHTGLLKEVRADMAETSDPVSCEIRSGDTPEEAYRNVPRETLTLYNGYNQVYHPRVSGRSAYLVLRGNSVKWAIDGMRLVTQPFGVQRYA